MELTNRVALVTGAGRGIGAAVARALAGAGARVALVARTEEDVRALARELDPSGERALALPGDVAEEAEVERLFDEAEARLGPLDVLVNNAGIPTRRPFEVADYPTADFDRILGVNLRGAFFCARSAARRMRERRSGTIVNIGSISGIRAAPDVLPYSVAKFGIEALTETLIAENTKHGIKCHAVCPGVTNSSIWDRKEVPLPADVRARMLEPGDVAEVVLFLLRLPHRVRIDRVVLTPNVFPMKLWDYPLLDS
ncbi:MAG TPA: SDR family NAD(P)-dependent oxidoreductase [Longimicrobiales bacterium]|nr:SDR family NAD(P)-dependent oxidoreductase [Longimicrobiales bacterium]